ncbi:DegV family protein [Anaerotignum lactatifermentans]|uniref:DegV family protein n=1 Tax=Anaerotignum lactatifermentans TaxID=160404 RepID=A0ABS2G828_9FIRM|nr:DegV family protein [Anaerotignum lactatifermentans]MBM6828354.1 DegV family protein [Anaerotignum lactatifermentans]MBM6877634.1 DegV family protein [Anaerotignum lactatifermentans]MBM6949937.1 DegV family protein [Anaerotignum lactatifermentans]
MSNVFIFSDGSCDLTKEESARLGISVIPFYVSMGGHQYQKELEELSLDVFYRFMLEEDGFPSTSLPSVHDYVEAFTPVLEQGGQIISCHITHTLSGSVQSAQTAKLILEETYPDGEIYIIDSWNATGSQALLLKEAARMRDADKTAVQIASYLEQAKEDARIIFMIGGLKHLQQGGRIGKIAALSSSLLKIKPVIILKGGEIHVGGAVRSRKKGLQKLAELALFHFQESGEDPSQYLANIGVTDLFEEVPLLREYLRQHLPSLPLEPFYQIGATISSHTGPGTTGVCFVKRFEAYNL